MHFRHATKASSIPGVSRKEVSRIASNRCSVSCSNRIDTRDPRLNRAPHFEHICGSLVRRFKNGPTAFGNVKGLALLEPSASQCAAPSPHSRARGYISL